jgi:hypothetical protein
MSGEAEFQAKYITTHRRQGVLVQKFNDMFAEGVPDVLSELPSKMERPLGLPPGMWVELKATENIPKRASSSWESDVIPSEAQKGWLRNFSAGLFPCMVVLSTPWGWIAVPEASIDCFFSSPHGRLRELYVSEKPTYGRVWRSHEQCKWALK